MIIRDKQQLLNILLGDETDQELIEQTTQELLDQLQKQPVRSEYVIIIEKAPLNLAEIAARRLLAMGHARENHLQLIREKIPHFNLTQL